MTVKANDNNRRTRRFPPWLKKRLPSGGSLGLVQGTLKDLDLATVCVSAMCPNLGECFSCGTATFMILGNSCTRDCRFCAVSSEKPGPLDDSEPGRVAEAVKRLGLSYVVITSVTRDDLPDGGAAHFARTIELVKATREVRVEVLTPDFKGRSESLKKVAQARPAVFNHNVETVPRLYSKVRPQADYRQSLTVLEAFRKMASDIPTKSGLMVGLGEEPDEVLAVMRDLRTAGCGMLTVGQYLSPSKNHLPVARFVPPEEFEELKIAGLEMGFSAVAAGPFVRSSYHAGLLADKGDLENS